MRMLDVNTFAKKYFFGIEVQEVRVNHPELQRYAEGHRELLDALQRLPRSMWHFRPAAGEWTIHQIVMHITDSESNSYIRVRSAIAEPGKRIMAYDEPAWAR